LFDRRREKTTFAVVFTHLPEAVLVEKKEKGTGKLEGKTGMERDWKEGRE
jgi:hypothetical protein